MTIRFNVKILIGIYGHLSEFYVPLHTADYGTDDGEYDVNCEDSAAYWHKRRFFDRYLANRSDSADLPAGP